MPRRSSRPRKGQRVLVEGTPFGKGEPLDATVEEVRTMQYPDGRKHTRVDLQYTRTETRGVWHTSVEPSEVRMTPIESEPIS